MGFLVIIFTISGVGIMMLISAKSLEERRNKPLLIFSLISRGDLYTRDAYRKMIHLYLDSKENFSFFLEKQVPMQSRSFKNKLISYLKERRDQYTHNMRDTKLLRRNDGLSEFFKSISEIERGGEIHDSLDMSVQEEQKGLN